ncbi:sortase [Ilumatobacter sp.]|uniref:sortase n=1 Tax=Ilumatobacter sp. TaxID=1967498 RepID=UPI003AF9A357
MSTNGPSPANPADTEPARIGRRRFIVGVGAVAGATAISSVVPEAGAQAAVPAGASRFVPLAEAVRLADTRSPSAYTYSTPDVHRIRVKIAGANGIPASASAAVLTVTAVNGNAGNFVTAYPSGGTLPLASNLNLLSAGEQNANLVTVKLGAGGSVDVYALQACFVIVDVLGYYEPVAGAVRGGRFVGLPNARRAIDTRPALAGSRSFTTVDLTSYVPVDASSAVINLTATETTGPSFFTALPYDAPAAEPATSSLNVSRAGDTRAAGVIVPVPTIGGRRRIKIFTLNPAKLIVDVVGFYTSEISASSEDGLFVPVTPVRLIDTRVPGGEVGKLWPSWVVEVKPPASVASKAAAIVANVTGVETRGPGFLTVTGARQPITLTSNVNFSAPLQVVPNHVITPVTATYGLQVYSSHGAHVIVDLAGYFTGSPLIPQRAKWVNPAPPAAPPAWTLRVPRLGLTSTVLEGSPGPITDAGHSWHWSGTGYMGEENAHVATFAHRTEAGAPYRNLHLLQGGDLFTVTTGDHREYTYRVVRRDLTDAANVNILAAVRRHPGTTLSLVACTVGHDRSKSAWPDVWAPTSLKYRIVVTAELVSWREF